MRSLRSPLLAITALVAIAVLPTACGGSDNSSSPTTTAKAASGSGSSGSGSSGGGSTTTTTGKSSAKLPSDACALLPEAQVTALLGSATPGKKGGESRDPQGLQFVSCQWGELTQPTGQVSVAVSVPSSDVGIDYLQTLVGGAAQTTTPVPVGDDGKLAEVFVRPGGGGVGKTILFKKGGVSVAIGQSGDTVDAAKLQTAAEQVASSL